MEGVYRLEKGKRVLDLHLTLPASWLPPVLTPLTQRRFTEKSWNETLRLRAGDLDFRLHVPIHWKAAGKSATLPENHTSDPSKRGEELDAKAILNSDAHPSPS